MKRIPSESLLAEIDQLADSDSPPTKIEFDNAAPYSSDTVINRFGTWNAALKAAGYPPNKEHAVSDDTLLKQLRDDITGPVAPGRRDFDGRYATSTYENRFGSWWQAVVISGLQPAIRRPLTSTQFRRFFEAAKAQRRPKDELAALLAQFTGLTENLIPHLSTSWLVDRAGDTLVHVPKERTRSGERWTFRLPSSWTDDGNQRETGLPELLPWYLDQYNSLYSDGAVWARTIKRVAGDADLEEREYTLTQWGTSPLVRPSDLRITGGVKMAQRGAPRRRIRRHLGIEHTNSGGSVEDIFIYCDQRFDDFDHPDWDPN